MTKKTSKSNTVRLGQYLRDARMKAGLTQKDVAAALGYQSVQFVSDWERGVRTPPGQALRKLAEMYRVSLDEFYDVLLAERIALIEKDLKKDLYG